MNNPNELMYTKSHEWVSLSGDTASIGITNHAQEALGDLVFVSLPEIGSSVNLGESFADVESVKAVSEVFSPLSGTVCEINEALLDKPELINEAPYDAWIIKVNKITEKAEFLTADQYEALED